MSDTTTQVAPATPRNGQPVRALLVSENDKAHICLPLAERLAEWLHALPGVEVSPISGRDQLTPAGLAAYDVLLSLIRLGPEASEAEEQTLTGFVARGGSLFGVHNSTIFGAHIGSSYAESRPGLHDLWGAWFLRHPRYQPFTVRILDQAHPITRGLGDFEVSDELYILDRTPPDARVLAAAEWEGQSRPMVYVKPYGAGYVYYCALGHDAGSWDHPTFRELLVRGVGWLADQHRAAGTRPVRAVAAGAASNAGAARSPGAR